MRKGAGHLTVFRALAKKEIQKMDFKQSWGASGAQSGKGLAQSIIRSSCFWAALANMLL